VTCKDPMAEKLASLARGELGAEESGRVLEHVERCDACSAELDFLADVVQAAATSGVPGRKAARTADKRSLMLRLVPLAAAAALLLFLVPRFVGPGAPDVRPLARWTLPAYVEPPIQRSEEDRFSAAMRSYLHKDYAAAESVLTEIVGDELEPADAPALLYRGAARVELGRLAEAEQDFEACVRLASSGRVCELALWSLANVRLLRNDADGARETLRRLVDQQTSFADVARERLAKLDAAR
jgi:tetratricopeptide (TPR) repeat protein